MIIDGVDTGERSSTDSALKTPSDAEMIAAFWNGEVDAESKLYLAYRDDALLAARSAAPDYDTAEDFVADAFQRVFELMRHGKGPRDNFRYYLRATIRTIALDWYRARRKSVTISDFEDFEPILAENSAQYEQQLNGPDAELDTDGEVVTAFRNLSERWRTLLYYRVVEGRSYQEIGELMALRPHAAAVMYQRAKEGLRKEYLVEIAKTRNAQGDPECQSFASEIASAATDDISLKKHPRLRQHVVHCSRCAANATELAALAQRFDKKPVALAIAGIAGSLVLPEIGAVSRS